MSYTEKTRKLLWGKSGGKCAFPGCNKDLIGNEGNIQGEICHIVARKKDGPRGKMDYDGSIDGEENLILLCPEHHKEIDGFPQKYTVEILHQYKKNHEDDVKTKMNTGQPWKVNFSQIYYMNIPRIEMQAALQGISFNRTISRGQCLYDLGWNLNDLMLQVSGYMNTLSFKAMSLNTSWKDLCVGLTVEINGTFRTKNVPEADAVMKRKYYPVGDLEKDAHLYTSRGNEKRVLTIDPNLLTTSTAFVNFRGGWVEVAGIGIITHKDEKQKLMIITPYVLGVPKTPFDDLYAGINSWF